MTPAQMMPQWLERLLRRSAPLYDASKPACIALKPHKSGICP
jgi:hypothetical protein